MDYSSSATVRLLSTEKSQECVLHSVSGSKLCFEPREIAGPGFAPGELLEIVASGGIYLGEVRALEEGRVLVSVEHYLPRPTE